MTIQPTPSPMEDSREREQLQCLLTLKQQHLQMLKILIATKQAASVIKRPSST